MSKKKAAASDSDTNATNATNANATTADKATTPKDIAATTDTATQEEPGKVVVHNTIDEAFAMAAEAGTAEQNPEAFTPPETAAPSTGPAMASGDVTPSTADNESAAKGKAGHAETAARAQAVRERARANRILREAESAVNNPKGNAARLEGMTDEQVAEQSRIAREYDAQQAKDRADRDERRRTGTPRPEREVIELPADIEERLADALTRIANLAEQDTFASRKELKDLTSRYSDLSQIRYKDIPADPLLTAEEYHIANARQKAKHIGDAADMAFLAAKASAAVRQLRNERKSF